MTAKPWRDPGVFIELEALIEVGLGDRPQIDLRPKQVRTAVRIYKQRHPDCNGQYIPAPEHRKNQEDISRLAVALGLKTRWEMIAEQRRQDIARKGALVRWIIRNKAHQGSTASA